MGTIYLVTGGGGNLARQLAPRLMADAELVVLFDTVDQPDETRRVGCRYVRGDLTSPEDVDAALQRFRPNKVLHLASLLSARCEQDRPLAWRVNVTAAFNLFESALRYNVETFFFPSSLASYGGDLPERLPEDYPQWPEGLYGVSKVTCERLGHYYCQRHGLDFRCLRIPMVISRFAHPGAASGYASLAFIESVASGKFTFKVNTSTRASAVYIRDVLDGIGDLIRAPARNLSRRFYNYYALCPTAQEIAAAISARVPGADLRFEPDPAVVRLIESWPRVIEDGSARKDWGWAPRYDLDRLADDFIEDLRREPARS